MQLAQWDRRQFCGLVALSPLATHLDRLGAKAAFRLRYYVDMSKNCVKKPNAETPKRNTTWA